MYYEDANQAQIEAERDKQRKDARNDREYLEETLLPVIIQLTPQ